MLKLCLDGWRFQWIKIVQFPPHNPHLTKHSINRLQVEHYKMDLRGMLYVSKIIHHTLQLLVNVSKGRCVCIFEIGARQNLSFYISNVKRDDICVQDYY